MTRDLVLKSSDDLGIGTPNSFFWILKEEDRSEEGEEDDEEENERDTGSEGSDDDDIEESLIESDIDDDAPLLTL